MNLAPNVESAAPCRQHYKPSPSNTPICGPPGLDAGFISSTKRSALSLSSMPPGFKDNRTDQLSNGQEDSRIAPGIEGSRLPRNSGRQGVAPKARPFSVSWRRYTEREARRRREA